MFKSQLTRMQINLNETEDRLCTLLNQVANTIKNPVTVRFAGGWVRDKLLGLECDDIDVAIDTMTGYEFASAMEEYIKKNEITTSGSKTRYIAKIAANPDKSKHLETANTKIFGMSIDFANLRSEEYTDSSRIPTMKYGTPLEDALRRDITINAMFYNIHSRKVEDPTNMGLKDLNDGLVRTPLGALQTFMDDPLRILRVIRFASRFDYAIHQDIRPCVLNGSVRNAFSSKISRERVGVEVEKMLKGPNPVLALKLICDFEMYNLVFAPPANIPNEVKINSNQALNAMINMEWYINKCSNFTPSSLIPIVTNARRILYLCAAIFPSYGLTYHLKMSVAPLSKHIVLNSLKFSTHDTEMSTALLSRAEKFHEIVLGHKKQPLDRKSLGLIIRTIAAKPLLAQWPLLSLVSLTLQTLLFQDSTQNSREELMIDYRNLMSHIQNVNLTDVHTIKPLLDGRVVASLLKLKPGPQIAQVLESIIEWQLEHEDGTSEECIAWLLGKHGVVCAKALQGKEALIDMSSLSATPLGTANGV